MRISENLNLEAVEYLIMFPMPLSCNSLITVSENTCFVLGTDCGEQKSSVLAITRVGVFL
jgi:hypothetical protein